MCTFNFDFINSEVFNYLNSKKLKRTVFSKLNFRQNALLDRGFYKPRNQLYISSFVIFLREEKIMYGRLRCNTDSIRQDSRWS